MFLFHLSKFTAIIFAAIVLASCGQPSAPQPPNTTVSGTVSAIKWVSPRCYKIERMLGGCGNSYFEIVVVTDASEKWSDQACGCNPLPSIFSFSAPLCLCGSDLPDTYWTKAGITASGNYIGIVRLLWKNSLPMVQTC